MDSGEKVISKEWRDVAIYQLGLIKILLISTYWETDPEFIGDFSLCKFKARVISESERLYIGSDVDGEPDTMLRHLHFVLEGIKIGLEEAERP